jgi:hypothetical protein
MPKPIAILQPSTSKTEGPRMKPELTLRILFPDRIPKASRRLCSLCPPLISTTAPTCPVTIWAAVTTLGSFTSILLHLLSVQFQLPKKSKSAPFSNQLLSGAVSYKVTIKKPLLLLSIKGARRVLNSSGSCRAMEFFHQDRIPRNSGT